MLYTMNRVLRGICNGANSSAFLAARRLHGPSRRAHSPRTKSRLSGSWAIPLRATVHFSAAFAGRLQELRWIEGRTVTIEYRWSEGRLERVTEIAAEFVRLKVDLIVAYGSAGATLKQATASIPIVLAPAVDPVGLGLVASLSHPGGNVTALSLQASDAAGKRLELLRDTVPKLGRLGILFDGGYRRSRAEKGEVQAAARTLGLEVVPLEIRRAEDIASAFDAFKGKGDALYVTETSLIFTNGKTITTLALNARLPTIFTNAETVRAGALMSYGPDFPALFRRAAEIVDKILRGTKAGDIPVDNRPNLIW